MVEFRPIERGPTGTPRRWSRRSLVLALTAAAAGAATSPWWGPALFSSDPEPTTPSRTQFFKSYVLGIDGKYGIEFDTYDQMKAFWAERAQWKQQYIELWGKRKNEPDDVFKRRIARVDKTFTALLAYSHFSWIPRQYLITAAKRESWMGSYLRQNTTNAYGPYHIRQEYFEDAVQTVKDPFGLFSDLIAKARDKTIGIEERLKTTDNTLWSCALKEAYTARFLPPFLRENSGFFWDQRAMYMIHLGIGNARNLAKGLISTPNKTVDTVISLDRIMRNGTLLKHPDISEGNKTVVGKVKTFAQFYDDLATEKGIPTDPLPENIGVPKNPHGIKLVFLPEDEPSITPHRKVTRLHFLRPSVA